MALRVTARLAQRFGTMAPIQRSNDGEKRGRLVFGSALLFSDPDTICTGRLLR
jgi:hypothetical protein